MYLTIMSISEEKSKRASGPDTAMGKGSDILSKESIYADQKVTVLGLLKDGKDAVRRHSGG